MKRLVQIIVLMAAIILYGNLPQYYNYAPLFISGCIIGSMFLSLTKFDAQQKDGE